MRTQKQHIQLYNTERKWLFGAVLFFILSSALYMYFVSASIHHVVMRKEIDRKISEQGSELSQLESAYIDAQHAVSAELATRHGFITTHHKIFIDQSDSTLVLNSNSF
jgi:hypothetical protein